MKAIVLLNPTAGKSATISAEQRRRSVVDALSTLGIETDIRIVASVNLHVEAKAAAAAAVDVVIAGGGDGTLSTVAGALAGTEMPLGILPMGTLNHFAKDLGIPLDLPGAAKVIAAKHFANIDVGEVNGRVFINNSSLGIYPHLVLDREAWRSRYGLSKWAAMIIAVTQVFRRFSLVRVRLVIEKNSSVRKTPVVFVGNNDYRFDLLSMGKRARLDCGEMSLYIANANSRWGILKLTLRALFGRLDQSRDFDSYRLTSCSIETRSRRLHVAADGEVIKLGPPLHYKVRAGDLRVCLPEKLTAQPARTNSDRPQQMELSDRLPMPAVRGH